MLIQQVVDGAANMSSSNVPNGAWNSPSQGGPSQPRPLRRGSNFENTHGSAGSHSSSNRNSAHDQSSSDSSPLANRSTYGQLRTQLNDGVNSMETLRPTNDQIIYARATTDEQRFWQMEGENRILREAVENFKEEVKELISQNEGLKVQSERYRKQRDELRRASREHNRRLKDLDDGISDISSQPGSPLVSPTATEFNSPRRAIQQAHLRLSRNNLPNRVPTRGASRLSVSEVPGVGTTPQENGNVQSQTALPAGLNDTLDVDLCGLFFSSELWALEYAVNDINRDVAASALISAPSEQTKLICSASDLVNLAGSKPQRHFLVAAVINHGIAEILSNPLKKYTIADLRNRLENAERQTPVHTRDVTHHQQVLAEKAEIYQSVVQTSNYWQWVNGTVSNVASRLFALVSLMVPTAVRQMAFEHLVTIIDQSHRLAMHMHSMPRTWHIAHALPNDSWQPHDMVSKEESLSEEAQRSNNGFQFVVRLAIEPAVSDVNYLAGRREVSGAYHKKTVLLMRNERQRRGER